MSKKLVLFDIGTRNILFLYLDIIQQDADFEKAREQIMKSMAYQPHFYQQLSLGRISSPLDLITPSIIPGTVEKRVVLNLPSACPKQAATGARP